MSSKAGFEAFRHRKTSVLGFFLGHNHVQWFYSAQGCAVDH
jgi:hypothetical protein